MVEYDRELRVETHAPSLPQLFDAAALAALALLRLPLMPVLRPEMVRSTLVRQGASPEVRTLALTDRDPAELMVHWLRELVYLHETHSFIYTGARIITLEPALCAEVRGARAVRAPLRELRGVSYHELTVGPLGDAWFARISFDV